MKPFFSSSKSRLSENGSVFFSRSRIFSVCSEGGMEVLGRRRASGVLSGARGEDYAGREEGEDQRRDQKFALELYSPELGVKRTHSIQNTGAENAACLVYPPADAATNGLAKIEWK